MTSKEVIELATGLSLSERFKIAEGILRNIREEAIKLKATEKSTTSPILAMAGIFDEEEAKVFESAIAESRKISGF